LFWQTLYVVSLLLLLSCGSEDVRPICVESDHFEMCAVDRYATYHAYVGCEDGQTNGGCFLGRCAPIGEYLFQMILWKNTCQNTPVVEYGFSDWIATDHHPLRFLLLCGYNRVVIDESWGSDGSPRDGLRHQIYEGEVGNKAIFGRHIKRFVSSGVWCDNEYTMAARLVKTL